MRRGLILGTVFLVALTTGGCGTGTVPVKGIVRYNGDPVAGALVSFISDDGKNTYSGFSNSTGEFEVLSGTVRGALPGQYKVTVTKAPTTMASGENTVVGDGDYMKDMMAMSKENGKKSGPPIMMSGKGGGMMMMPGMAGGTNSPAIKSELPLAYASGNTTTLKVTIPHDGPVILDLRGDAPKGPAKK